MSIFKRKRKNPQNTGISRFKAGLIAIVLVSVGVYFGFTKANPFANPYKLTAVFETANNLKPKSPVRIAGVQIGKVKSVTAITPGEGNGAARWSPGPATGRASSPTARPRAATHRF